MLKKRAKLKIQTPRRQISRARTNRTLLNRQRSFFLQHCDDYYDLDHQAEN
jgi:hypothetical protein